MFAGGEYPRPARARPRSSPGSLATLRHRPQRIGVYSGGKRRQNYHGDAVSVGLETGNWVLNQRLRSTLCP